MWTQAGWRSSLGTGSPSRSARGCCRRRLAHATVTARLRPHGSNPNPRARGRTSPEIRCFSDSMILVTGLRWTEKVWKSCGPEPTVSGCWTMTRTDPELVP